MTTIYSGTKTALGRNRGTNLAMSRAAAASSEFQQDIVEVTVKTEESDVITEAGSERFYASFHALLTNPTCREISVQGPRRDRRGEAIKDTDVLRLAFQAEGESGLKRVAKRLDNKQWTKAELAGSAEVSLDGLLVDPVKAEELVRHKERLAEGWCASNSLKNQEKLIPPGEGWVRFNEDMLWDPRSEVYFAQLGQQQGKYLMQDAKTKQWQEVNAPHTSAEIQIQVRAAGCNILRKGTKLDRTVLLPELPKIARLALKFPLSFLDSPASAFAIFQGLRSAEAADWCAKNFHTKLIPLLAKKIHTWETKELENLLQRVLKELDSEILKSSHAYSGSSAIVAVLIGDRLVISGVGQVRVALLFDDGSCRELLGGTKDFKEGAERERVEDAQGIVHGELLHGSAGGLELNDARRILYARSNFEVLQLDVRKDGLDEKQIKTAYRKLALKVHPDKRSDTDDLDAFNKAFARLESAKEALEALLGVAQDAIKELCRVLQADVHTREGAAELLGVDGTPSSETAQVAEEAAKASRFLVKRLEPLEHVAIKEHTRAVAMCKEAVETLRRPASKEALPRQEALRQHGLSQSRALGVRDMRFPSPIVTMSPESISWTAPRNKGARVALLVGATAALDDKQLSSSSSSFKRCPKASALRWCQTADAEAPGVVAACLRFEAKGSVGTVETGPAAKRQKLASQAGQRAGTVFVRHILFRHMQLRVLEGARREGAAKGPGEAEAAALQCLQQLLTNSNAFVKLCRELSDCCTADQPGTLAGHLGWVLPGELEPALADACFALAPNEFGDLVASSRGIHVIQRLG